jgi:hypothetical protein
MANGMANEQGMQGQAPEQAQGQQGDMAGQDSLSKLVSSVGQGMQTLTQAIQATEGAPPEAGEKMAQAIQLFTEAIEVMAGGAPTEQGAIPVDQPEGQVVGPQG